MSNLILSLPLSQTHSDLRSAESIHDFRPYVSLTGFAFLNVVRCGFTTVSQKHLYLISCENARNHNACIHLLKNRDKDGILHY